MMFLPVRIPFFFGDREYQWRSISESAHVPFFRPLRAICFTADDFLPSFDQDGLSADVMSLTR
jgi:hypothetical protein